MEWWDGVMRVDPPPTLPLLLLWALGTRAVAVTALATTCQPSRHASTTVYLLLLDIMY